MLFLKIKEKKDGTVDFITMIPKGRKKPTGKEKRFAKYFHDHIKEEFQ